MRLAGQGGGVSAARQQAGVEHEVGDAAAGAPGTARARLPAEGTAGVFSGVGAGGLRGGLAGEAGFAFVLGEVRHQRVPCRAHPAGVGRVLRAVGADGALPGGQCQRLAVGDALEAVYALGTGPAGGDAAGGACPLEPHEAAVRGYGLGGRTRATTRTPTGER